MKNKLAETGHATAGYNLRNAKFYSNGNVVDINDIECAHRYVYSRGGDRKTAYLHYVDGVEIWEYNPAIRKGWELMFRHSEDAAFE